MKNILLSILLLATSQIMVAQQVVSYKKETVNNKKDRAQILNALRGTMYKEYKQDFIFTINTLNVQGNYAWLTVEVARKDGKPIVFKKEDEGFTDCCHTEALLQKKNGKWVIREYADFSTDVWYANPDMWKKYKLTPKIVGPNFNL